MCFRYLRHATTFITKRYNLHGLGRIVSSHARSCVEDVTTRWLGLHLRPTAVWVQWCLKANYTALLSRIAVRVCYCVPALRNSLIATRPEPQPNPTLCIDLLYTGTRMRPSSYAKLIQPTTQPKQTNQQPNPNTTLLRGIIVNIYIGQHKKYCLLYTSPSPRD